MLMNNDLKQFSNHYNKMFYAPFAYENIEKRHIIILSITSRQRLSHTLIFSQLCVLSVNLCGQPNTVTDTAHSQALM